MQPTSGHIRIAGEPVEFRSPRDAFQKGIATVYQELSLVPELTVAHNILLADLPTKAGRHLVDWPAVYDRAAALLKSSDLDSIRTALCVPSGWPRSKWWKSPRPCPPIPAY